MKNTCCTYFKIVGDFDPESVSTLLGLRPEKSWKKGDARRDASAYDFSHLEIGRCTEYDAIVSNQMRKTVSVLLDKIDLLNQLRRKNGVRFYLEIVPCVCVGEQAPCLAPSPDIVDFCHATRTEMDIDLYIRDSKD